MRTLCLIAGLAGYGAMGAAANAQPTPAAMRAPSPDASAAQQIEAAHTLQSDFVAMYFRLEAARRTAGRANIGSVPAQDDPVRMILEAQRAAPHDDSWNGTLYAIRMYEYNTPGSTSRPNPAVRWNGVVGGEVLPVIGFDPPPQKRPTPAPAPSPAPTPPSPETPTAKPRTPAAQPTQPATPSLDELLGITPKDKPATPGNSKPTDAPAPPTGAAPDQSKADLDRLLTAQEMGDAFKQAIALMGDASTRLNDHKDPGLGTQRVQEDVVKRLDQLLASLDKQQQQQQSSSQQKPEPKQEPGQKKPQQGQQQSQQQPKEGDGMRMHDGPTLQQGQLNPQLESARAAWGSLPARVRAMLMQGTEDRFSSRYKAMTQEYYKRLAEENSK